MKRLIIAALAVASLAVASLGAQARVLSKADNPELVRMGKQAVAALLCANWATHFIPKNDKEAKYAVKDANYADEVKRLRAYGLKTGRAFIARAKEVTKSDANAYLPSLYMSLDYSQGIDFALGQLVSQVNEAVTHQFEFNDRRDKYEYDGEIWDNYARSAYDDGHCDLIGEKP